MAPKYQVPNFLSSVSRVSDPLLPPRVPLSTLHPTQDRAGWANRLGGHILRLEEGVEEMGILHIKNCLLKKKVKKM